MLIAVKFYVIFKHVKARIINYAFRIYGGVFSVVVEILVYIQLLTIRGLYGLNSLSQY